ncbi:MAG: Maf family nucleotide pyrophosphatase [Candidatus Omnitrophica bacterium]|nr:Maf family nucleotide pyrophosphatase [Candidatus Omnitrophota bacterium]
MRRIYLGSRSKARKELFKVFGFRFKTLPTSVKERRRLEALSCAQLVKLNALKKAQEVAKRIKKGIVVAFDTVVIEGKEIFGKPKDLKDAKKMLKRLSQKPQWVYTGIAIIDKDKEKTITDYEKTKVYMDKLSDKEINYYLKYDDFLNKAGGFDIQGKGALFVRRIEGCFYNVVGLPLRKLYRMFKKMGIRIFLFCLIVFLSSCSTEYNLVTGRQEIYYYSTDKEIQLGQSIVEAIEKEYKLTDDPLIQKRVEEIGNKIAGVCDRKELVYHFKVLESEEINAVALPGGFIYVNKGLIDKIGSEDELAAVLGHEIGHIVARHNIKKLQAIMGYNLVRILLSAITQSSEIGSAADLAFLELLSGYSREDELLADRLSARYLKLAGYNPYAMITFLKKLEEIERRKPARPKSYFKTHPYVPDRIRAVKQEIGEKISFTDYINIEGKKK